LKFLPFVFKHLRATWVRSASSVVAMALCVFLIQAVPGVKRVAATFMFSGVLPTRKEGKAEAGSEWETDWTSVFQNAAVDAEPYFAMSPELLVPPDQFRDFLSDLRSNPGTARGSRRRPGGTRGRSGCGSSTRGRGRRR
jgi:hypothetical protein